MEQFDFQETKNKLDRFTDFPLLLTSCLCFFGACGWLLASAWHSDSQFFESPKGVVIIVAGFAFYMYSSPVLQALICPHLNPPQLGSSIFWPKFTDPNPKRQNLIAPHIALFVFFGAMIHKNYIGSSQRFAIATMAALLVYGIALDVLAFVSRRAFNAVFYCIFLGVFLFIFLSYKIVG